MGDGYGFRKIRRELGVTAFGINAIVLPPGYETGCTTTTSRKRPTSSTRGGRVPVRRRQHAPGRRRRGRAGRRRDPPRHAQRRRGRTRSCWSPAARTATSGATARRSATTRAAARPGPLAPPPRIDDELERPSVLLLHGQPGGAGDWAPWCAALGDGVDAIADRPPGWDGRQRAPRPGRQRRGGAGDPRRVTAIERAMVVGHSLGAAVAAWLAVHHPSGWRRWCSPPRRPTGPRWSRLTAGWGFRWLGRLASSAVLTGLGLTLQRRRGTAPCRAAHRTGRRLPEVLGAGSEDAVGAPRLHLGAAHDAARAPAPPGQPAGDPDSDLGRLWQRGPDRVDGRLPESWPRRFRAPSWWCCAAPGTCCPSATPRRWPS